MNGPADLPPKLDHVGYRSNAPFDALTQMFINAGHPIALPLISYR